MTEIYANGTEVLFTGNEDFPTRIGTINDYRKMGGVVQFSVKFMNPIQPDEHNFTNRINVPIYAMWINKNELLLYKFKKKIYID